MTNLHTTHLQHPDWFIGTLCGKYLRSYDSITAPTLSETTYRKHTVLNADLVTCQDCLAMLADGVARVLMVGSEDD